MGVGARGGGGVNFCRCGLPENVGAEGGGEPHMGFVAGAAGRLLGLDAAVFRGRAAVFETLTAFGIPVHEGCRFHAHTELTASAEPRSVFDREIFRRVVNPTDEV